MTEMARYLISGGFLLLLFVLLVVLEYLDDPPWPQR